MQGITDILQGDKRPKKSIIDEEYKTGARLAKLGPYLKQFRKKTIPVNVQCQASQKTDARHLFISCICGLRTRLVLVETLSGIKP